MTVIVYSSLPIAIIGRILYNVRCVLVLLSILSCLAWSQTIQTLEGLVEMRSSPEDAWRPAGIGDILDARGSLRTLQGDVTLLAPEYTIRLSNNTELLRGLTAYELINGKAYIDAQAVKFQIGGPVKIEGQARIDTDPLNGQRLVVLNGIATATLGAGVTHLETEQQLVIPIEGDISVSQYFERDPWYLNLSVLATGSAAVVGMMGSAEIQMSENWKLAELNDVLEPGHNARTAQDSWLELRFEDGSLLRLQANTEITLSQAEAFADNSRRTLVTLNKGKIWAVIEDGQPFEIETPGLVAGVRGTKFRVDASEGNEDALLKTFEGAVAGIVGFEVIEVGIGTQFEPQAGLAELQKDALDEFNLNRDSLISAPNLKLDFPVLTDQGMILIQGQSDPGSLVMSQDGRLESSGTFTLEQPLYSGFNLVEVRASLIEGGKEAIIIRPVIRTGPEFIFALREPQVVDDTVILSGFVSSGSTLTLNAEASSSFVTSGYFQVTVPFTPTITLTATSKIGQVNQQTLTLGP